MQLLQPVVSTEDRNNFFFLCSHKGPVTHFLSEKNKNLNDSFTRSLPTRTCIRVRKQTSQTISPKHTRTSKAWYLILRVKTSHEEIKCLQASRRVQIQSVFYTALNVWVVFYLVVARFWRLTCQGSTKASESRIQI